MCVKVAGPNLLRGVGTLLGYRHVRGIIRQDVGLRIWKDLQPEQKHGLSLRVWTGFSCCVLHMEGDGHLIWSDAAPTPNCCQPLPARAQCPGVPVLCSQGGIPQASAAASGLQDWTEFRYCSHPMNLHLPEEGTSSLFQLHVRFTTPLCHRARSTAQGDLSGSA